MIKFFFPYKLPPGLREENEIDKSHLFPLILIQLYSEKKKLPLCFEGLVDSGADGIVLPKSVFDLLELPTIGKREASGLLKSGECSVSEVGLIIGRSKGNMLDLGKVEVIISESDQDIPILIGRNPIFQYFEIIFREYEKKPNLTLIQKQEIS